MKERGRNGGKMARREEERKEGKNEDEMERKRRERNHNDSCLWIKLL